MFDTLDQRRAVLGKQVFKRPCGQILKIVMAGVSLCVLGRIANRLEPLLRSTPFHVMQLAFADNQ